MYRTDLGNNERHVALGSLQTEIRVSCKKKGERRSSSIQAREAKTEPPPTTPQKPKNNPKHHKKKIESANLSTEITSVEQTMSLEHKKQNGMGK